MNEFPPALAAFLREVFPDTYRSRLSQYAVCLVVGMFNLLDVLYVM